MNAKPVQWMGTSRNDVRSFPADAQRKIGYALFRVQCGREPHDWKPMSAVGPGVREIRIRVGRHFRLLYVTEHEEAVYVLHSFEKKTKRTSHGDIALGRRRLALVPPPKMKG